MEYRVEQDSDTHIMRVEGFQNIITFSIVFLEVKMLDGYKEKDIENAYKQIMNLLNSYALV